MKNKQKGFIAPFIIITVIVLLAGGSFYYIYKTPEFEIDTITEEGEINSTTTVDIATSTESAVATKTVLSNNTEISIDADIQAVSDLMTKYKVAYESGNVKSLDVFFSKATLDFFNQVGASSNPLKGSKIAIENITRFGKNISLNIVETKSNGVKETQPTVLILENGQWKIDMTASFELAMKEEDVPKGDTDGYVDLVVTGIKVYPSRPIVNNEDVEIEVTIKNIGTKTSEKGTPLVASIVENTAYTPTQGGSLSPLGAGKSVTWNYTVYSQNKIFNRFDTAGKKTVRIELNKYKDVVEKNYNNNVFTQGFEVYGN